MPAAMIGHHAKAGEEDMKTIVSEPEICVARGMIFLGCIKCFDFEQLHAADL